MANTIQLHLLENKTIVATVNNLPYTIEGGYRIVAGEENATEFQIASVPAQYKEAQFSVSLVNSKGYPVPSPEITENKFTLPSGMAVAGYGSMLFEATINDETVVWLPFKIKVWNNRLDWKDNTVIPDFIEVGKTVTLPEGSEAYVQNVGSGKKAILNFGIPQGMRGADGADGEKGADGADGVDGKDGKDGNSVFIRYSANPNGSDMTETWEEGQRYLGTYIGNEASTNPNDYMWMPFVGDAFCEESNASGAVTAQLVAYADKTYTSTGLTSITVIIPNNVKHGFYAGINFRTVEQTVTVAFTNFSSLPLKLIVSGITTENYSPGQNKYVRMIFDCDGVNIYCTIVEV